MKGKGDGGEGKLLREEKDTKQGRKGKRKKPAISGERKRKNVRI